MKQRQDAPIISVIYDQQLDGTWQTRMYVSGLPTEEMAALCQQMFMNMFCSEEITPESMS